MSHKHYINLYILVLLIFSPYILAKEINEYKLYIFTYPADATVKILNITQKFNNGMLLTSGEYEIEITKPGYIPYKKWITINNSDQTFTIDLKANTYKLYIDTNPKHAQKKFLNFKHQFKQGMLLKPGKYVLEISSAGYKTFKKTVEITNSDIHLGIDLISTHHIENTKKYNVFIQTQDNNITFKNLNSGIYEIKISKSGYKTKIIPIEIQDKDIAVQMVLSPNSSCEITTEANKITVSINEYKLRFIKINHGILDDIALRKQQAYDFHNQAKRQANSQLLYPMILKSVFDQPMPKVIPSFWIQQKPISPEFYQHITQQKSTEFSYENAIQLINKLNIFCDNQVKFNLPTEKQFVYLAKKIYNPVKTKQLKSCQELTNLETNSGVKKLLGNKWQLTKSKCISYRALKCDSAETYIKKGGSIDSVDATECMPEYRAESTIDIQEPNTTFRLVLIPAKSP